MINQDLYRWATKTHLYKITLENALFSTSQKLSYQDDSSFPTKLIISLETALSSTSHIYKTPIQSEISTPKWLEKLAHFAISIRLYLITFDPSPPDFHLQNHGFSSFLDISFTTLADHFVNGGQHKQDRSAQDFGDNIAYGSWAPQAWIAWDATVA